MDRNFYVGRIALIGSVATVAACAVAYVFFGSSKPKKRRKDVVPGLTNLGNWCFMNAVLQSLAPSATLLNWLSTFVNYQKNSNLTSVQSNNSFSYALLKILKILNNDDDLFGAISSPAEVLQALRSKGWVISCDEQDAHELFHVLTTTLEEEYHGYSFTKSLLDIKGLEYSDHLENCSDNIAFRTQSPIRIPKLKQIIGSSTKGLIASRLTCKSCGFENPIRYDSFDSISLPIPDRYWGLLRLEDCLNHWSSSELVHGVTCDNCTKLHSPAAEKAIICKSTFSKQLCIAKLPDCLCIHFVRTLWLGNSGVPTKKYDHVSFPEFLAMDMFLLSNKKKAAGNGLGSINLYNGLLGGNLTKKPSKICDLLNEKCLVTASQKDVENRSVEANTFSVGNHIFHLKSVIVHVGDTFSGHFVTYRRGPLNSKLSNSWFYTSDTVVRQVSFQEVAKSNAYMLIYERVNSVSE